MGVGVAHAASVVEQHPDEVTVEVHVDVSVRTSVEAASSTSKVSQPLLTASARASGDVLQVLVTVSVQILAARTIKESALRTVRGLPAGDATHYWCPSRSP